MKSWVIVLVLTALAASACSESSTASNLKNAAPVAEKTPDLELQGQIAEIAKEANGKVGVYAVVIETGETISLNADERFAMQSVVKVPIAMAVMKLVDEGKFKLDQKIQIAKGEMVPPNMRSPIRDETPNGGERTVRELIRLAISESDGTAADVLQRVAGGASGVQVHIDSLGIGEMRVKYSHKEFGEKWEKQYENWVTPKGAVALLNSLWTASGRNASVNERATTSTDTDGRLSVGGASLLLKFMTESNNPRNRIVAGLPRGTVVAHKTGTGGTRDALTSATNDVGIITLPNENQIVIAIFVGDSRADLAIREGVIAKITKIIIDNWSKSNSVGPRDNR